MSAAGLCVGRRGQTRDAVIAIFAPMSALLARLRPIVSLPLRELVTGANPLHLEAFWVGFDSLFSML